MRHLNSKVYLNRSKSHREALVSNLAYALFERKRIETTLAKARFVRSFAEKLITKARTGSIAARRLVFSKIQNKFLVQHLFEEIAPRFVDRPGGYTRIIKLGVRKGDASPMALVELVGFEDEVQNIVKARIDAKETMKKEEKKPEMARSKIDRSALENESAIEKMMKKRWKSGKWHPGSKKTKKSENTTTK